MDDLKDLRRRTGAALCMECGKCSSLCPLASFGDFSAARTMSMHDPVSEFERYSGAVERCLTCAACEIRCPQGVQYAHYVRGLRAELPVDLRRKRPHGEVFQIAARIKSQASETRKPSWLDGELRVADEGDTALFVGCLPIFDAVFGESLEVETVRAARAAVRLLNAVGVEPVLVAGEGCCGHDLLWSGDAEGFTALARHNCDRFASAGIRQIVTVCGECCRTWRLDYPEVVADYRPEVKHLVEFLAPWVESGELSFHPSTNGRVTYQDPCRLARHLGVVDEPRRLLVAIPDCAVQEMEGHGADGVCCGTPGFVYCDSVSRQLQSERLQSAAETGAETLLTSCPKCLLHFRCAQAEDRRRSPGQTSVEVEDIAVFLASSVEMPAQKGASAPSASSGTGEQP